MMHAQLILLMETILFQFSLFHFESYLIFFNLGFYFYVPSKRQKNSGVLSEYGNGTFGSNESINISYRACQKRTLT